MRPTDLSALRWGRIVSVLSMDVTCTMIGRMGLLWPQPAALRELIRNYIVTWRELENQGALPTTPFHVEVLAQIELRYGADWVDYLIHWGEDVYQFGGTSGVPVFLWAALLKGGGLDGKRDLTPPPPVITALRDHLRTLQPVRARNLIPTTSWDHLLLSRGRYNEWDNPLEDVEGTVRHVDFLTAWAEVAGGLDTPEVEEVTAWARREASRLGMPVAQIVPAGTWLFLPSPPAGFSPFQEGEI